MASLNPEWDRLLSCAQKNAASEIHRLITEDHVSANHSNAINQSALHIAALWGNIDAVKALLSNSADVKAQNKITGATPLHSCVQSAKKPAMNRVECAKLLIDAGADLYMKDLYGVTPLESLELEIERSELDPNDEYTKAMKELLENAGAVDLTLIPLLEVDELNVGALAKCLVNGGDGANINIDERHPMSGKTALHIVIDRLFVDEFELVEETKMRSVSDVIHLLLSKGADANALPERNIPNTDPKTFAPLHKVCKALFFQYDAIDSLSDDDARTNCLEELCVSLLSNGAKPSTSTVQIMHDASRKGSLHVVKFWIEKLGVDPNTKGRQGLTPLHFAARSGRTEIVKYLITYLSNEGSMRVDPSICDDRGKTALDAAIVNRKSEIVELLTPITR
jgi:antitoxin component of RelBE/YafQ-DinJ toxin-antitoxin module